MRPAKIRSGGQAGVDRAALDFAIERDIPWAGWAPRGWLSEDGGIPAVYRSHMREHHISGYQARTEANVDEAAATLIIYARTLLDRDGKFTGGTLLTARYAKMKRKPLGWVYLDDPAAVDKVRAFVDNLDGPHLNIAGPRESKAPGIHMHTWNLLREVWP